MSNKGKDAQAGAVILEYLTKQNRPYSATDVHSNLHNMFGKTAVVKTLEALVAEGKIKSKAYNKQIVYVADQSVLPDVDAEELKEMDSKIVRLSEEHNGLIKQYKEAEQKLNQFKATFTTKEGKAKILSLETAIESLTARLDSLKNNADAVSPEERKEVMSRHTKQLQEVRKRKRVVKEMVGAVLEGYPHSKRALLEEAGVDEVDHEAL